MTARTITFAVQLGSGGAEVARAVAERLGFNYYDWEVTSQAAAEAGVSVESVEVAETAPSHLDLVMEKLFSTGVYTADQSVGPLSAVTLASAIRSLESRQYRQLIEKVVLELGKRGNAVIVGHAGQVILRDRVDVLKVLICGSIQTRSQRLADQDGLSLEKATAIVGSSDHDRISFFRRTYGIDILNGAVYDLVLNSDRVPIDVAAEVVVALATKLPG